LADLEWTDISLEDGEGSKKTDKEEIKVEVVEEAADVIKDPPASNEAGDDGEEEKRRETRAQRLKRQRDEERSRNALLARELEELRNQVNTLTEVQTKALEVGQQRYKESLEVTKANLEKEWGDAFDTGDKGKMLEIQRKLSSLDKEDPPVSIPQKVEKKESPRVPTADPRALSWHRENPWFNPQSRNAIEIAATAFALKKSEDLINDGYDPQSDEYYEEIDKSVSQHFSSLKKSTETPPKKTPPVAGGTRGAASSNSIRLTPEEVQRASELGVDLKTYARNKSRLGNGDNGYTVIEL
jgi:hypothetical protein